MHLNPTSDDSLYALAAVTLVECSLPVRKVAGSNP